LAFVSFEGIDGSGKSTALDRVATALRHDGVQFHLTREETDGPTGEAVRRSIRERWDPLATAFLFAADRAQHVAELRPLLSGHVLCDRFVHSTYAYQGALLEGRVPDVDGFLRGLHAGWCPMPDRVVLFDLDAQAAVQRTERRGATTPYEKVEFLEKVRARYLAMARQEPARFVVVDASRAADAVAADALQAVRKLL
jgi:dTMP kinase